MFGRTTRAVPRVAAQHAQGAAGKRHQPCHVRPSVSMVGPRSSLRALPILVLINVPSGTLSRSMTEHDAANRRASAAFHCVGPREGGNWQPRADPPGKPRGPAGENWARGFFFMAPGAGVAQDAAPHALPPPWPEAASAARMVLLRQSCVPPAAPKYQLEGPALRSPQG